MGLMPKSITKEIKLFGGMSMMRIMGLVVVVSFVTGISEFLVIDKLKLPFTLYCIVNYLILTSRTSNPKKVFAVAMIDGFKFMFSPKTLYGNGSSMYKELKKGGDTDDEIEIDQAEAENQLQEIYQEEVTE